MPDPQPHWSGECMLLQWNESSTRGRTITLLLPEDEDTHPFRDLTVKSGKRAGQRFMVVFVPLGDDDQPEPPRLSATAAVLCRDPSFWEWATGQQWEPVESEEDAKQFMYRRISIESRSALDTDERAAQLFRLMEAEYRAAHVVFRSKGP